MSGPLPGSPGRAVGPDHPPGAADPTGIGRPGSPTGSGGVIEPRSGAEPNPAGTGPSRTSSGRGAVSPASSGTGSPDPGAIGPRSRTGPQNPFGSTGAPDSFGTGSQGRPGSSAAMSPFGTRSPGPFGSSPAMGALGGGAIGPESFGGGAADFPGGSGTAGSGAAVRLSALEFDVLTEHLELTRVPLVLRVPSPGRTHQERAELVEGVWRQLAARGLGDRRDLDPRLHRWLRLLTTPLSEVDGRAWFDRSVRLFAAADTADDAVLVVKEGEHLAFRPAAPSGLAREAVSVLPPAGAGPGRSVTVRSEDLDAAAAETGGDAEALEHRLRARGVRPDDAEALTAMVREAGARGQFGAAARDRLGRRVRAGRVVAFFDTPHGRYAQLRRDSPSGEAWSTIAPADTRRMIAHVEELRAEAG